MVADTENGVSTDGGKVAERSKTQQHLRALRATWPLVRAQLLEPTFIAMSWVLFVGPLSRRWASLRRYQRASQRRDTCGSCWRWFLRGRC